MLRAGVGFGYVYSRIVVRGMVCSGGIFKRRLSEKTKGERGELKSGQSIQMLK
jgi:hypothetical protein